MRTVGIVIAVVVAAIGLAAFYYNFPDHRYRLTIEIETPEGIKTGSSVIAVYATDVKWGLPESTGLRSRIEGEAVFVDLGAGRNVIAILAHGKSGEQPDRVNMLVQNAFRAAGRNIEWFEAKYQTGTAPLKGELIPTLVTISDLKDPKTARVVSPDDFEAVFGPGYRFTRASVEVTRDAVTTGIEGKLAPLLAEISKIRRVAIDSRQFNIGLGQFARK